MLDIFLAYTMHEAKQLQATLTARLTTFFHIYHMTKTCVGTAARLAHSKFICAF